MTQADKDIPRFPHAPSWQEQVSAWLDGEAHGEGNAAADETGDALDRAVLDMTVLRSADGRQLWQDWHLIGDVLRSPELAIQPSNDFHARMMHAINSEALRNETQDDSAAQPQLDGEAKVAAPALVTVASGKISWTIAWGKRQWADWRAGLRLSQWRQMGWTGGLALAAVAVIVVWALVPHFPGQGTDADGSGAMLANAGELERNPYVQAHRQFVGSNPIRQISLDVGFNQ